MNDKTRICRNCGTEKEIELFEIDSRYKNKYTNRCRDCKNELDDKASRAFRGLKQRSLKTDTPIEVTTNEIRQLFNLFDGCCAYCGQKPDETRLLHLDHIVALSEGGRNTPANLIPACASCNSSKHNKPFVTHFFDNRDKISDQNFAVVVHYISLLSGLKNEEVVADMTNDYAQYLLKQMRERDEKEMAI